jgi:hypothetical protein
MTNRVWRTYSSKRRQEVKEKGAPLRPTHRSLHLRCRTFRTATMKGACWTRAGDDVQAVCCPLNGYMRKLVHLLLDSERTTGRYANNERPVVVEDESPECSRSLGHRLGLGSLPPSRPWCSMLVATRLLYLSFISIMGFGRLASSLRHSVDGICSSRQCRHRRFLS